MVESYSLKHGANLRKPIDPWRRFRRRLRRVKSREAIGLTVPQVLLLRADRVIE
jgi:hypothetical protein